jgi:hypothetical protein
VLKGFLTQPSERTFSNHTLRNFINLVKTDEDLNLVLETFTRIEAHKSGTQMQLIRILIVLNKTDKALEIYMVTFDFEIILPKKIICDLLA